MKLIWVILIVWVALSPIAGIFIGRWIAWNGRADREPLDD